MISIQLTAQNRGRTLEKISILKLLVLSLILFGSLGSITGFAQEHRGMPMMGEGMRDSQILPTPHTPFYQEHTFLILATFTIAGAGFVAFWLIQKRWRRRRGPVNFVSEAVLVVDLVNSTHLGTHYGEGFAMRARNSLKDRTMEVAEVHGLIFAENTGDGCFMTFPSVLGAVRTAVELLKGLKDRPPDMSPGPPLELRAGISYGEILIDDRGARHGTTINKAFRLEGLSNESFVQKEGGGEVRDRNRILLSEEAEQELRLPKITLRSVGFCTLKGFNGLHRVFEMQWDGQEFYTPHSG